MILPLRISLILLPKLFTPAHPAAFPFTITAETIHNAICSLTPDAQTQSHLRRYADVTPYFRKDSAHPPSRAEVVSHAVNNLLCVINANADVLADHFADSNLAARSVHEIKKAAKSAADLIRSL